MKLENEFTVAAPIEETWALLLDVPRVAECLPGATVDPNATDGSYTGQIKVKLGPMTVTYKGTLRLAEVDSDRHDTIMEVKAKELKGQGTAAARIRNQLSPEGQHSTRITVETDLSITGRPAQLGRGIMQDVAANMLDEFGQSLERELLSEPASHGGNARPSADISTERADRSPHGAGAKEGDVLDVGNALYGPIAQRFGIAVILLALVGLLLRARKRWCAAAGGQVT